MGRREQTHRLLAAGACSGADPRRSFNLWPQGALDVGLEGLDPAPTDPDEVTFFGLKQ